ncbi:phosphoserine aminotransferase [Paraburkholderia monticola]|uniref:UPF0311 protein CI15_33070 n=1 Tax=Paraburkholderia monticola TaxID=1399968 RepID=A0A149PBH9_9BURK|nr:DUF3237 domain-containing protein [Paraburkholderia monticola]KXU82376.1 phosphoserine aminotransferase [Paraburkholderia monticola]
MPDSVFETLPVPLKTIATQPLFVMRLDVKPIVVVGQTPGPFRRVGIVPSGTFAGERLSGTVLDGGSDWQTVRDDGSTTLDVRLLLKSDDDVTIAMSYRGVRHGPAELIERLERGQVIDPASYYFRIAPIFEAPAGRYEWLNRIIAVGTGHRFESGPVYSVFEVL